MKMLFQAESDGAAQYHANMVMVKVRPSAAPLAAAMGGTSAMTPMAMGSPGFAALATFERAGFIKQVIPLGAPMPPHPMGAVAALAASATPEADDPLRGISMLELEEGVDHQQMRLALANDPHIEAVSRVPKRYLLAQSRAAIQPPMAMAVPPPLGSMWNMRKIQWQEAIDAGMELATAIHVAVLDTGIDMDHPDLPKGDRLKFIYAYPNGPVASRKDIVGHGTHVAGTICALNKNSIGINGICDCRLSAYKIFGDDPEYFGGGFSYYVDPIMYRKALAACLNEQVDVINLSIGGPGQPDIAEKTLFQQLMARGTVIVAAMGNESSSRRSYPAAIAGVIAVGATNINDTCADFSNYGSHIALCAPGVGIWSTLPTYHGQFGYRVRFGIYPPAKGDPIARETDYDAWDGTSMASPHVAAAAALALANLGRMSPSDIREKLMQSADKVPAMGKREFTNHYGAGRLNLLKLIDLASGSDGAKRRSHLKPVAHAE